MRAYVYDRNEFVVDSMRREWLKFKRCLDRASTGPFLRFCEVVKIIQSFSILHFPKSFEETRDVNTSNPFTGDLL